MTDDDDFAAAEALLTQVKPFFQQADLEVAGNVLAFLLANWMANITADDPANTRKARAANLENLVSAALNILEDDEQLRSRPQ